MAAKAKTSTTSLLNKRPKVRRPGVHAKSKTSKNKKSKNYTKTYIAQGK